MVRKVREREITVTRTVKQVEKECPVCHRSFWGAKISRYCSRACRNRANYERHEEEYRQQRVEKYQAEKKATPGKR
jgi:hypothetical protein